MKYIIKFEFDQRELENNIYNEDELHTEIDEMDDNDFGDCFQSEKEIKKFEEWWNDGLEDEDKIIVSDADIEFDQEGGTITITTNKEVHDEDAFADETLEYLFEGEVPSITLHISGYDYVMDWDGFRSEPYERRVEVESDETVELDKYKFISLEKE